tara:strand:- start:654 stop:935 length:282 start_codon:yes stop_codon:yes gene_type:complete
MTVSERIKKLSALQEEREFRYGEAYKQKGEVMENIFPSGARLDSETDFARYSILDFMVSKIIRYANNFDVGGHADSLDDISVYAQMLRELDDA